MRLKLEKRPAPSTFMLIATPIGAVLLTMLIGVIVFDAIGIQGEPGNALFRQIRTGGAFIQYGALSGAQLDPALVTARRDEVAFSFLWLRNWVHSAPRAAIEAAFAQSFAGIRTGVLGSDVDGVFALRNLPAALARQDDPARSGKLLIAP